jgi:UDP-N-acetyl-D-glucosamine dehydrogenase
MESRTEEMEKLKEKIETRKAKIVILGLGYVGLPLAVEFASGGFPVTGIDLDTSRVAMLRRGKSYVPDVDSRDAARLVKRGKLKVTSDYRAVGVADAVIICVPTPLRKTKDPDLSYVLGAIVEIARRMKRKQLIILESTTYPGTCEELILPYLNKDGRRVGRDFFLAFSPERVDPANRFYTTRTIPKIIGGVTKRCTSLVTLLYGQILEKVHPVSSSRVAEMAKLLENTFRSVNIAMANEMALICRRMGIDVWEVIEAAATKPFGFMPFYPGPGLGGHCLPIDPLYLSWKARLHDFEAHLIQVAAEINARMPEYVFQLVSEALNERGMCVNGAKILVIGVAYKRNVGDVRESPALEIMRMFIANGALVSFCDPYVGTLEMKGKQYKSEVLCPKLLRGNDCSVIVTDHSCLDYHTIVKYSPLVIDTRNATHEVPKKEKEKKVITI